MSPETPSAKYHVIRTVEDADQLMVQVRNAAVKVHDWITETAKIGDPMAMLKHMKFDLVGFHPIGGHELNVVEQINQTWTYAVAIAAARQLLLRHPDAQGFRIAPGAHFAQALDIMSVIEGLVGAETFAAVDPRNNRKLEVDLAKLSKFTGVTHRYVFFMSPAKFPGNKRWHELEKYGVQVWSVEAYPPFSTSKE